MTSTWETTPHEAPQSPAPYQPQTRPPAEGATAHGRVRHLPGGGGHGLHRSGEPQRAPLLCRFHQPDHRPGGPADHRGGFGLPRGDAGAGPGGCRCRIRRAGDRDHRQLFRRQGTLPDDPGHRCAPGSQDPRLQHHRRERRHPRPPSLSGQARFHPPHPDHGCAGRDQDR